MKPTDEYSWLGPLFNTCVPYAPTLGRYLAKVMNHLHFEPSEDEKVKEAWIFLAKEIAYLSFDKEQSIPRDLKNILDSIKTLGAHQLTEKLVQPEILEEAFIKRLWKALLLGSYCCKRVLQQRQTARTQERAVRVTQALWILQFSNLTFHTPSKDRFHRSTSLEVE